MCVPACKSPPQLPDGSAPGHLLRFPAQNPDKYIKTTENIKNNYDVIIPGHSDIIDKNNLCNSPLQFRIF